MDIHDDDNLLPSDSFDALFADAELDALGADLVPPSPILTPSQVAFSWSCGSIPVLLYDEAYATGDTDKVTISTSSSESPPAMEPDHLSAGVVEPESYYDDSRYNDDDYEPVRGTESEDDYVQAVDSPDSGTRPGPVTPRRASSDASQRTSAIGPAYSVVSDADSGTSDAIHCLRLSAIDPVAYQHRWVSTRTASGGLQPGRTDNMRQGSDSGPQDAVVASDNVLSSSSDVKSTSSRESGLRIRSSRPMDNANLHNEVSRWSADSDSVFLSDSTSNLSESISTQNDGSALQPNSAYPCIVINSSGSGDPPDDDDDEYPAFQTPTKASLRPAVSWISSRSWDYDKYEAYVAREEPSRHALISNSLESYVESRSVPQSEVTPPNRRTVLGNRDINVLNIDTPRAGRAGATATAPVATGMDGDRGHHPHNAAKEGTILRSGSPRRQSPHPTVRAHAPAVPDNSWLADICVQFLIDQEGFRAAEPKFRYTGMARVRVGHAHGAGSRNSGSELPVIETVQMAQFRMTKRKSYHFHHAPFETPPILRRVTVNGDETHDYVSKQALLTLKANGVYVLHGQEALVPGHGHGHSDDAAKLHWKLEYVVDDRVLDVSQRIMDGEKVLTLLSFSCSPALLLPSQAKKNTLMQVFKKSVAPKLVAEKLQPPGMGACVGGVSNGNVSGVNATGNAASTRLAGVSNPKSAVVNQAHIQPPNPSMSPSRTHSHITHSRAKTSGWAGLHRRGQSHSIWQGTTHGNLVQKVAAAQPSLGHRTSPSHGHVPYTGAQADFQHDSDASRNGYTADRQRRNSSAGERPSPSSGPSMVNAPFNMVPSSQHHWAPADPPPLDCADVSPTRHILPPEQLTKLLDSIAVPGDVKEGKVQGGASVAGRPLSGTLSSALTERIGTTAGALASTGFAPLPAPTRHRHHPLAKSMPKDIPPI